MNGKKIALIGCMGSGKSAAATEYARLYDCKAVDVDEVFTRRYGDISEFFAAYGEEEFRKQENDLLIECAHSDADIIACGGGSVLCRTGMAALRRACDIVYLTAPIEVLCARISNSARPLGNKLDEILSARERYYTQYADYTVKSCGTVSQTASDIYNTVKSPRADRYDVLLCDADDTVLDFSRAMRYAICAAAKEVGVKADDRRVIEEYRKILPDVWGRLERGEIDRTMLAEMRFKMLAERLGERFSADAFNDAYMRAIKTTRFVIDGALAFLDDVRRRGIAVYIITNSYRAVASERLKAIDGHIDGAFISEDIGFDKPDVRFFDWVQRSIGSPDKSRIIVFGDGVFPDMHGGTAFGVDTCLYDPSGAKHSDDALYSVHSYDEFFDII